MAYHADHLTLSAPAKMPAGHGVSIFSEAPLEIVERWVLGTAWALKPPRYKGLPALTRLWLSNLMAPDYALPDPEADLYDGLTGIAHDLSVPTLIAASERGLYPFAHFGPLKWWSPARRSLLFFDQFHMSRRLRGYLRSGRYRVTFDRDFDAVIKACAERRQGRLHLTWITPRIMRAYAAMFDAGHAHSFEVCNEEGKLVGGGYGVTVGGVFITESQFSRDSNASKIGYTILNWHLAHWGYAFNDNKRMTPVIRKMGFRDIPRAEFLRHLAQAARLPGKPGRWQAEGDLFEIAAWQ